MSLPPQLSEINYIQNISVCIAFLLLIVALIAVWWYGTTEDCTSSSGICCEIMPNSSHQSPINIATSKAVVLTLNNPLKWTGYDAVPDQVTLEKTIESLKIVASFHPTVWPTISGADMMDGYAFQSMQFLWGISSTSGSEHTIDEHSFALELQVIHVMVAEKTQYLIVSYLYRITECDNPYMDPVILNLPRLSHASCTMPLQIDPFPLAWFVPPVRSGFFSYGASLTSKPSEGCVTWFVHPEPLAIGRMQIEQFWSLQDRHGRRMIAHRRPVQSLNDRVVIYNKY